VFRWVVVLLLVSGGGVFAVGYVWGRAGGWFMWCDWLGPYSGSWFSGAFGFGWELGGFEWFWGWFVSAWVVDLGWLDLWVLCGLLGLGGCGVYFVGCGGFYVLRGLVCSLGGSCGCFVGVMGGGSGSCVGFV